MKKTDPRNKQEYQDWKQKCKKTWTPEQRSQYIAKLQASQSLEKEQQKQTDRKNRVSEAKHVSELNKYLQWKDLSDDLKKEIETKSKK